MVAAKTAMDWLQDCARTLAKKNLPLIWTTIDGFPVMQAYPDMKKRRLKTKYGDKLVYLTVQEKVKGKLDSRRQANGASPNWVHSADACHLRMSVNLASDNGVTHFSMIHDSFGCHAADIHMLAACLRKTFVSIYHDHNPLELFKLEGEAMLDNPLPAVPDRGTLNIKLVEDSEFFFA